MNDNNIRPNVITLNSVLTAITYLTGSYKEAKEYALKVIAEMKQFDVEPCLATYNLLLNLFCADRGPKSYILEDILNHIDGKEFKIYEKDDVLFFSTAMDRCRYHLQDKDLAYRVNKLLHTGTNYNFIGDSYKESVYYRNFFMLLCQTETIEELMDQYKYYVPHVYIPEISVMIDIVKTVTMNGANEYYPGLWSDIETFQLTGREELLQTMLSGMILNRSPQLDAQPSDMAVKFGEIAWKIFELINSQNEMTRNRIVWTGSMLGDIMTLCLFANDFEKATTIFDMLTKYQQDILGSPSIEPFCVYIDYCIREKNVTSAMNCLQYVSEAGFSETEHLCRKIVEHFNLSPLYKSRIAAMVGSHVFKESEETDKTQEKHTATAN